MKRALLAALFFVCGAAGLHAQTTGDAADKDSEVTRPARDLVMIQLTYDGWANKPDSINTTGIGRGFNAYLCYDFPIKNSNFSFAAGIGIGTSNIYLKDQEIVFDDTAATAAYVIDERQPYSKYKLNTAYLEAPFELRFFGNNANRNKGFKAAVGLRAGMLVGAHTKGKRSVQGSGITDKENTKRYLERWRVSGTVRIGWGNFSLFGSYNINSLFKENQGPKVSPYSIGISLTGL